MLLFSLAILFTGCDYWCQDEYHVINNTDDTLQIIVNYDTLRYMEAGKPEKTWTLV